MIDVGVQKSKRAALVLHGGNATNKNTLEPRSIDDGTTTNITPSVWLLAGVIERAIERPYGKPIGVIGKSRVRPYGCVSS